MGNQQSGAGGGAGKVNLIAIWPNFAFEFETQQLLHWFISNCSIRCTVGIESPFSTSIGSTLTGNLGGKNS